MKSICLASVAFGSAAVVRQFITWAAASVVQPTFLNRPFDANFYREHIARSPMKYSISGGPEHQS